MKLTLKQIKAKKPCLGAWTRGLDFLNKKKADDTEVTIGQIIKVVGVNNALWVINNCVRGELEKKRNMYADIANEGLKSAKKVLHIFEEKYPNDDKPRKALENAKDNIKRCREGLKRLPYVTAAYAAAVAYAADAADAAAAAYAADAAAYAAYAADGTAAEAAAAADAAAYAAADAAADAAAADAVFKRVAHEKAIKKQAKIILKYFGEQK